MFSRFFIDRPIFATVLSVVITLGGADCVLPAPADAISAGDAADGASPLHLPRGQRRSGGPERGGPHRAAGQRRREHDLHGVAVGQRRLVQSHGDVPAGSQPEPGPGAGAEQGESGPADAAGRAQADRSDHPQNVARHAHVGQHLFAPRPLRPTLFEQLRADAAARRVAPRAGRERRQCHGPAGLQHEDLAGPGQARRAEPHGRRRGQCHPRAECPGGLGPDRASAGPPGAGDADHAVHARPAGQAGAVRQHHPPHDPRRPDDAAAGRRPRRAGGAKRGRKLQAGRLSVGGAVYRPVAGRQRPGRGRAGPREDGRAGQGLSGRPDIRDSIRHHALHPRVHRRGVQGAARRGVAGGVCRAAVPAKLAVGGHSADRRAGGHRRHVRRDGRASDSA